MLVRMIVILLGLPIKVTDTVRQRWRKDRIGDYGGGYASCVAADLPD